MRRRPALPPAGGQAPDIYLVQLDGNADTFRSQAKDAGLKYSERFANKSLFKGVPPDQP